MSKETDKNIRMTIKEAYKMLLQPYPSVIYSPYVPYDSQALSLYPS